MNREQKLDFIEENHPELYSLLKANIPGFVYNVWNANIDDLLLYNSLLGYYCGEIQDMELIEFLRFK